jgi:hypothetical protein
VSPYANASLSEKNISSHNEAIRVITHGYPTALQN